ncbi:MAG: siderophore-interacting protein [Paludibacterium sp.]|uniref:siderophore-interacting protein n=1 Tax=Paludibacterium sp. TaxID=1917523 RepID=UPI0025F96745|nr:siderophore-interacting protein [Paludibacterium sp.]MBV8049245.1 siderophore-interacting protein [Paludibacterium sp.]MBV8646689.1 siderophore-interacting protein [Paludibacterium sp.]
MARDDLVIERVRHPLRFRLGQVCAIHPRGAHWVRITFRGPDLVGFVSASFDDHVKVFFPAPGEALPRMPQLDADGLPARVPEAARPIARDYTPRRFDPVRGELDIEFVLHGDGPGARWAAHARIGQTLGFGGPRGSLVIPTGYDWHWLIGDASALPAIGRRLEMLPSGAQARVLLTVDDPADRLALPTAAQADIRWLPATDGGALYAALASWEIPPGEGYVWAAGELTMARAVRQQLLARGIDKQRLRAVSYWQRGETARHQTLDD